MVLIIHEVHALAIEAAPFIKIIIGMLPITGVSAGLTLVKPWFCSMRTDPVAAGPFHATGIPARPAVLPAGIQIGALPAAAGGALGASCHSRHRAVPAVVFIRLGVRAPAIAAVRVLRIIAAPVAGTAVVGIKVGVHADPPAQLRRYGTRALPELAYLVGTAGVPA